MSWVEAKTVFGHGPPEVTERWSGDLATQQTERALVVHPLEFDDDVTAPYGMLDGEPTEVDATPLR